MDRHLGSSYARTWASRTHLAQLNHLTAAEALDDGVAVQTVWRAVHEALGLPASER
jgi:hypothetical protein